MKEVLLYLKKLQDVEEIEKDLESKRVNHPGYQGLFELRDLIHQQEAEYKKLILRQETIEKTLAKTGTLTDESIKTLRQLEQRIYSGSMKNLKEMERLQAKCNRHQDRVSELEDKALEYLQEQEDNSKLLVSQGQELSTNKGEFNRKRLKVKEEVDTIKKQLKEVRKEKERIMAILPSETLNQYKRIQAKKTPAVALIESGQCTGCRMRLSIMLVDKVQLTDGIIYCENCGRILLDQEEI